MVTHRQDVQPVSCLVLPTYIIIYGQTILQNQIHQVYVPQCGCLVGYLKVYKHVFLLQSNILCLVFFIKIKVTIDIDTIHLDIYIYQLFCIIFIALLFLFLSFPLFSLKSYYMLWNVYCYILNCLYPICKSLVSRVSRIICLICTLFYFYSYNYA